MTTQTTVPDPIVFDCPKCGKQVKAAAVYAGKRSQCPKCKHLIVVPGALPAVASNPAPPAMRVTIADIDIPFERLVVIWFKVWAASVPLVLLLAVVWFLVWLVVR